MMALFSNATKFTLEGGDITLHEKETEMDVQVQVSDTRIGVKRGY